MRLALLLAIILFPILCAAQKGQGHDYKDSLLAQASHVAADSNGVKTIDALAKAYSSTAPDSGLYWASRELALAEQIAWRKGKAMAWNQTGINTQNKSAHAAALDVYFKALHIYEELGDRHGIAEVRGNIGNVYYRQKNYPKAMEHLNTSLGIANELGDKLLAQFALGYIAGTYRVQGSIDSALSFQVRALKIAEESGDQRAILLQTSGMGTIYATLFKYNMALVYYFRSLRMAQELGEKQREAIALGNIGGAYYDAAADTLPPHTDSLVAASRAANYKRCISYLHRAIVACREAQVYDYISAISETLSDALAETGDYKGALAAYKQFKIVNDSLHNNAITEKIAGMETQRALVLKEKDIQLAKLAVAKKKNERGLFIVIIILLVGLFAAAFAYAMQRARHRQRRKEETIRRRIAQDLHDDLGSALSAINIYSNVAEQQSGATQPLLRKITESSGRVMEAMSDIVWSINHSEDGFDAFVSRMREYAVSFFEAQPVALHFDFDEQMPTQILPAYARKDFYLIYKEALNNAAKYAGAKNIWLSLKYRDGYLVFSIRDDGKGFDMAAPRNGGNGLKNMTARAAAIGGEIQMRSALGAGTEIVLLRIAEK